MGIWARVWLRILLLCVAINSVQCVRNVTLTSDDPSVHFDATWNPTGKACSGNTILTTAVIGGSFTVEFTGTGIAVNTLMMYDGGWVNVYLDGAWAATAETGMNDDTKSMSSCVPIFSQSGLPLGQHTLKVELTGSQRGIDPPKFRFVSVVYLAPDDETSRGPDAPDPTVQPPSSSQRSSTHEPTSTGPTAEPLPSQSSKSSASISSSGSSTSSPPAASQLSTAPITVIKTAIVTPDDPRIQYTPSDAWQTRNESVCANAVGNAKVASLPGATITFPFKGTSISVRTLTTSTGVYLISLDGRNENRVNSARPPSSCVDTYESFHKEGLEDIPHTISISLSNSTLGERAITELAFAGFRYTGSEATNTTTTTSPAAADGPAFNAVALGAGIGGAVAGLLLIGIGVFAYMRWLKRRSERMLPPSAIYQRSMQPNGRPPHRHHHPAAMGSTGSWPSDEPIKETSPDEYTADPAPQDPQARWRPRSFAAISRWSASINKSPL